MMSFLKKTLGYQKTALNAGQTALGAVFYQ
jgi:hypothetical protein